MPFISQKDAKEDARVIPYKPIQEASFEEGFDASVGLAFDESLSISSMLNNEGYFNRGNVVERKVKQGLISKDIVDKYSDGLDYFDYDGLARELNDPEIKQDFQLEEEKSQELKQRREYSLDVQERAPGSASFVGTGAAVMLDPINVATMGLSTPFIAAKGLGVLAKTLRGAAGMGVVAAGTETLIQPFVYAHKKAINSPYSVSDSIEQIAFAGLGGGVLGGTAYGIGGLLRKTIGETQTAIDSGLPVTRAEIDALDSIKAMADDLEDLPRVDLEKVKADLIVEARQEFLGQAGNKITRGEVKALKIEIKDLEYKLSKFEETTIKDVGVEKVKGKKARAAKTEAETKAKGMTEESRRVITDQIEVAKQKLARNALSSEAESALSRLDQGILPDSYKNTFDNVAKELVGTESKYLMELHEKRIHINEAKEYLPKEKPRIRVASGQDLTGKGAIGQQLKEVDFDNVMNDFNQIESPRTIMRDANGKLNAVDAREVMAQADSKMDAMNQIRACFFG
jgi:hypothetical protein